MLMKMWGNWIIHGSWKCKMIQLLWKSTLEVSQNIKHATTKWSRSCTAGSLHQRNESLHSHRTLCVNIYQGILCNSPQLETTEVCSIVQTVFNHACLKPWSIHGICVCSVTQFCPTACDSVDCSPPDVSVHGISHRKNTGVGSHSLLQGNFRTRGWKLLLLHWQADTLPLSHLGSLHQL